MSSGRSFIIKILNRGCTVLGITQVTFFTTDDMSEKVGWIDLNIKEEDVEVGEEVEMMEDAPTTDESQMSARQGEKRALYRSCSPESASKTKVECLEVKREPDQYENVFVEDWRKYIFYLL